MSINSLQNKVKSLMYSSEMGYWLSRFLHSIWHFFSYRLYLNDKLAIKIQFEKLQGYNLNLKNPQTLNEKINWLKIYDRTPLHTLYADKFAVRQFYKEHFGAEGLIELAFHTNSWKDIVIENMPDYPFIIKPNHGSGWYHVVEDKHKADWNKIRTACRFWLSQNYYYVQREWQYKNIPRLILVEKLLIPKNGGIPNNFRLHSMSGIVEIISVNVHKNSSKDFISYKFNRNGEILNFNYQSESEMENENLNNSNLQDLLPNNLDKMISIAEDVAKDFAYVRVDFYEIDGKFYNGEITFHDSSGYAKIDPFEWDVKLGKLVNLEKVSKSKTFHKLS